MKDNLLEALPLFVGAVLGVWFYYSILPAAIICALLIVILFAGLAFRFVAKALMKVNPETAVTIWQGSVLTPIALIALGGWASTWLIDNLPGIVELIPFIDLPDPSPPGGEKDPRAKQIELISAALSTALTAFLGAMFLDSHKQTEGGNWPPAQIRKAMQNIFGPELERLKAEIKRKTGETDENYQNRVLPLYDTYSKASKALYSDQISIQHESGWAYSMALERASIVRQTLLTPRIAEEAVAEDAETESGNGK